MVEEDVSGRVGLQPASRPSDDPDEACSRQPCARRVEETGWDVELDCTLICVHQWRNAESGDVSSCASALPACRCSTILSDRSTIGILRALWLTRDEIARRVARLRSPMVLMSIDDWLAGHRLPLSRG